MHGSPYKREGKNETVSRGPVLPHKTDAPINKVVWEHDMPTTPKVRLWDGIAYRTKL